MAAGTITIGYRMLRRRAEVDIKSYQAEKVGVPAGVNSCHVLGVFQGSDDRESHPVFVCELDNGSVIDVVTSEVRFVDTKWGDVL